VDSKEVAQRLCTVARPLKSKKAGTLLECGANLEGRVLEAWGRGEAATDADTILWAWVMQKPLVSGQTLTRPQH